MRNFSDFEKSLIQRIITGTSSIPNLCDVFLEGVRISIKLQDNAVDLLLQEDIVNSPSLGEIVNEISRKIITTVNLIQYLTREGYIVLYHNANRADDPFIFGRGIENVSFVTYEFPDTSTVEILLSSFNKAFLVTQSLIDYVNQGFVTPEEKKQRQNIRAAWLAIIVSSFIGIVGIVLNIIALSKDTKIDQAQLESMNKASTQISENVKSVSENIKSLTTQKAEGGTSPLPKKAKKKSVAF